MRRNVKGRHRVVRSSEETLHGGKRRVKRVAVVEVSPIITGGSETVSRLTRC